MTFHYNFEFHFLGGGGKFEIETSKFKILNSNFEFRFCLVGGDSKFKFQNSKVEVPILNFGENY